MNAWIQSMAVGKKGSNKIQERSLRAELSGLGYDYIWLGKGSEQRGTNQRLL